MDSKKIILAAICLFCTLFSGFAQQQVSGKVTDVTGEPVIGAGVVVESSGNGVVTGLDGTFTVNASKGDRLSISSIGYVTKLVAVAESPMMIVLDMDNTMLDDVVVIGYGFVKRRDLTGAVSSVKGSDLAANPVSNVSQALQGKLSGVNVISEDGRPGASVSVRVRGGGSVTQSNEPLYIVDGFPVGGISDIPASEIESIDVLKDASSTAIYGARGANGVILVTTRSAKAGRVKVSYDGYVQMKSVARTFDTMSAQDYLLFNWGYASSRGAANGDGFARYFGLGSAYGNHYKDYASVATHDYTHDLLRTAVSHSHTVNVSGGSEDTKVNLTLGYVNDEGIKINSDYNRFNAALKVSQKLAKRLTLDLDARYVETNTNGWESSVSGRGSTLSSAYFYRPIDNPLGGVDYSDVTSAFSFGIENIDPDHNPVLLIEDVTSRGLSRSFRASAALSWEIVKGLTARSEMSMSRGSSRSTYYENGYSNKEKRATLGRSVSEGLRSVTTLSWNKDFNGRHSIGLLAGNEIASSSSEGSSLSGNGYPDAFDYDTTMGLIQMATGKFSATNTINVPSHTVSFFGRANYGFMDRYLLTATFRADGSSKFAPNNRWGYFPAAAAAWRVIDEPFMENAKSWLSNLKLRLSYGTSGADNISSNLWRETWKTLPLSQNTIPIGGEFISFYAPDGLLANPDLKWETTISRNLGIDYGFLDGRVNGAVELYWNTTKDLLMAVPVDNTTGYSYQYQNFGRTSNKGVELSLNAVLVDNSDWHLDINALYNYNRNNLDDLANADQYQYSSYWSSSATVPVNDYMLEVGRPIGLVRGFRSNGWYTAADFDYDPATGIYALKAGVPDIAKAVTATQNHPFKVPAGQGAFPGCAKFEDVDGSGVVNLDDVTEIAELMPRHTGGFSINARWRDWDIAGNFNWVLGGKVYNVNMMIMQSGGEFNGIGRQRLATMAEAYKVYDIDASGDIYAVTDPAELDRLNAGAQYPTPYHQSGIAESRWLEDGSYLRLQNLTLGYTLPNKLSRKVGIERLRLYLTASNLFCLTSYSGLDPEVNTYTSGRIDFGGSLNCLPTMNMDYGAYPRSRSFTFGANITF